MTSESLPSQRAELRTAVELPTAVEPPICELNRNILLLPNEFGLPLLVDKTR